MAAIPEGERRHLQILYRRSPRRREVCLPGSPLSDLAEYRLPASARIFDKLGTASIHQCYWRAGSEQHVAAGKELEMDQIRVVIAELEVVLAMLESREKNVPRIKATLNQALSDLNAAVKAITGENPGGGET